MEAYLWLRGALHVDIVGPSGCVERSHMPGLSLVHDPKGALAGREKELRASLGSLLHYPNYEQKVLLADKHLFLGYTKHAKYPITVFEDNETLICVEGRMYAKAPRAMEAELLALARSIFAGRADFRDEFVRWLLGTDGDFIVFMLHKGARTLCLFNDALARLPFYYCISDGVLVASREPRFMAGVRGRTEFDQNAVAEYLLFGYTLGDRTLFEDVRQLPAASILTAGTGNDGPGVDQVYHHNFEDRAREKRNFKEQAESLRERYRTSLRDRHDPIDRTVVGLSGGMDSRMASSCLASMGLPFASATFQYDFYVRSREVGIAKEVAGALQSEWRLFQMGPAKGRDVRELLRIKNGLNFLGMSFSMSLVRAMKEAYGDRITLVTADGGDMVLRDIRPARRIGSIDGLVGYILSENQLMPVNVISDLTGVNGADIVGNLRERLESYDERDMRLKYVHFIICERCMNWNFQGEDRNRYAFWPVTPFYSMDVFTESMNCPFDFKKDYRIVREMLISFSPQAAAIINANWNLPITSPKMHFYWATRRAFMHLPASVRRFIKAHYFYRRRIGAYPPDSPLMRCFFEQLGTCGAIADYLSVDAVRRHCRTIDKMAFDHLFTLTSTIEDFTGARSTLDGYADLELI
jgi:asparagine synthase (glutamine-hydrolysing)